MMLTKITVKKILAYQIAPSHLPLYIKRHFPRMHKLICKLTCFLEKFGLKKNITLLERLYCIEFGLDDRPHCLKCLTNYVCSFFSHRYEYSKWCNASCLASDIECINKSKHFRKAKYGNENFTNREKAKLTILKMCENDSQYWNKRVKKTKATKLEKYGDETYVNAEKAKLTLMRHASENQNFWIEREQKSLSTKMERYGDPTWNNRESYHQTCLERFGVMSHTLTEEWKMQVKLTISNDPTFYDRRNEKAQLTIQKIPDFYEKRDQSTKKTCLDRYGVEYWVLTEDCYNRRCQSIVKLKLNALLSCEYDLPLFSYEFLLLHNLDKLFRYSFKCSKCGKTFTTRLNLANNKHYHCPKCFPRNKSKCERAILEFVKSILCNNNSIFYHDRKAISPLEIDILVKCNDKTVGIEYNGIYWHSIDSGKSIDKNYHLNKSMLCEKQNILLISIFEDEWLFLPTIVKDKIAKSLDICLHINASNCTVEFNNLQIELKANGQLVAALTFCKSRMNINEEWEFKSYYTKNGIVVDDGLKLATKKFEEKYKPKSIVAFIDLSYSNEQDFLNAGFSRNSILSPRLWWYNGYDLTKKYHDTLFKNEIAQAILNDKFDNSIDLINYLKLKHWLRVYDCGQIKVTKYYN